MQNYERIPDMLRLLPRWVCYRLMAVPNGTKKIPITPITGKFARVDEPDTWGTFEEALAQSSEYDGIGFMLGDGIFGVDLDHVIENGRASDTAMDIVETLNTYTEVSPSGTGLHIIGIGVLPEGARRREHIEMYDQRRFFTVTGKVWQEGVFVDRTAEAAVVHEKYLAAEKKAPAPAAPLPTAGVHADTVNGVIEIASHAANGQHFSRLMAGDISEYPSPSEADLALCSMAAFYANGNAALVDGVFRASALMRPKWDQRRGAYTYGEKTVQKAMDGSMRPEPKRRTPKPAPACKASQSAPQAAQQPMPALTAEAADMTVTGLCRIMEAKQAPAASAVIATGFSRLDKHLGGGLHAGLYVLGAEATVGKTTLALQLARTAAGQGSAVLFVSYEQSAQRLGQKLVNGLHRGDSTAPITPAEAALLSRIMTPDAEADLSTTGLLVLLERYLAECVKRQPNVLPLVVIDYLQAAAMQEANIRTALDALVAGLRRLVQRYPACVLAISSLNRAAYMSPVRRDSFKESGGIEYAADVILGLHLSVLGSAEFLRLREDRAAQAVMADEAMTRSPRMLTLTVLKNRDGGLPLPMALRYDTAGDWMTE